MDREGLSWLGLLILLLFLPALFGVGRTVGALRRCRYSVGEFWLLLTLVGLGIGLTAMAVPQSATLAAATILGLEVGALLSWGGAWGLASADRGGIEDPGRRLLGLLFGLLLFPGLLAGLVLGAAGTMALLVAVSALAQDRSCLAERSWFLALLFGGLALPAGLLLLRGLYAIEQRWYERERAHNLETGLSPPEPAAPPEAPASDPSDRSDGSDGSDGSGAAAPAPPPPPVDAPPPGE